MHKTSKLPLNLPGIYQETQTPQWLGGVGPTERAAVQFPAALGDDRSHFGRFAAVKYQGVVSGL